MDLKNKNKIKLNNIKFAKDKIYKNKNKHMSNKELKDKFKKYGKIPTKVGKCFTE